MHRQWLVLAFLCLLTSGLAVDAQGTETTTMSPNMNATAMAANMSETEHPTTIASSPASNLSVSSSSSPSPISSSSSSSSSSSTSSSSPSTMSMSISTAAAAPSPSSAGAGILVSSTSSASATTVVSNTQAQSTAVAPKYPGQRTMNDPTYLPMVAAIVSGFGLLVLLLILFLSMAIVYRYLGKEDASMVNTKKKPKNAADVGGFYTGMEPQSNQHLVSSMSINSFGSSPSDARLESHVPNSPGVHYNRGYDVDHNPSGAAANGNGHEDSYRPIQIVADVAAPRPNSTHI